MSDLIKREDALNAFGGDIVVINAESVQRYIEWVMDRIKNLPSIDAVKHGRWIPVGDVDADGNQYYSCSECGCGERHVPIVEVRFCWNCGARMDGEENG